MNPSFPHPTTRSRRLVSLAAWLGVALLLASGAVAALALRSHAGDSSTPSPAPAAAPVERAVAVGHVDVEHGVTPISAVQPGRVVEVQAQEGKAVEADAPLFVLDDTVARCQVDEAKAALESALLQEKQARTLAARHIQTVKAQRQAVAAAEAEVKTAQALYDKAKRRFDSGSGVVSSEDVKVAELLVKKAEAGLQGEKDKLAGLEALKPDLAVELAAKDVEAKKAQLQKAEKVLKEHTVRAPFAGTPLRVLVSEGEVLGPNSRQPALFFCPNVPRIVRAEVEQEFAARVAVGQTALIQDDATGGGEWKGKVDRISDWYSQRRSILLEPLQFNDVRTLECIIRIDPGQPPLRIGQRVRVTMQ
jgi:multidrug resistance efflux pump